MSGDADETRLLFGVDDDDEGEGHETVIHLRRNTRSTKTGTETGTEITTGAIPTGI